MITLQDKKQYKNNMFTDFGQIQSEQIKGLIKGLQFLTTTEKAI